MVGLYCTRTRLAAITLSTELGFLTFGGIAPVICAVLLVVYGNLWVYDVVGIGFSCVAIMFSEIPGQDMIDDNDAIDNVEKSGVVDKELT